MSSTYKRQRRYFREGLRRAGGAAQCRRPSNVIDFPKKEQKIPPEPSRDDITTYMPLVEVLARRILNKGYFSRALLEDLVSVGRVVLCESFQRYKELSDEHFHKSVIVRVRGEMIDYLRRPDHRFSRFALRVRVDFSTSPCGTQEADRNEESLGRYVEPALRTMQTPERCCTRKELYSHLHKAITGLPSEERGVIERVYFQEAAATEGTALKRSHASKIKRRALKKIKRSLDSRFTREDAWLHLVQD